MNETLSDPAGQPSRLNRAEVKGILALACVYMTRMLGLFMILPVFVIYAKDLQNISPLLIGFAIGIYGLAQACLQIPLGALSDRVGRKKVIVSGLCLFVLGSLLAGMSDNIYWIILGRFLQGSGAIASAIMALVSDITRTEVRTKAMALIGASIGSAFLLALILGPLLYGWVGMQGIFYSTAGLALVAILVVLTLVPSKVEQLSPVLPPEKIRFFDQLRDRRLYRLNIGVFALHAVLTSAFIAVPLMLIHDYQLTMSKHSSFYAVVFLLSFVLMWPLLKFMDKSSQKFPILLIFMLFSVQLLLASIDMSFIFFAICIVVFFVAFNSLEASMPSLLSKLVHPAQKGLAMGIYSSSQFLGAFCGGVLGGWASHLYGLQGLFCLNALLCLCWLAVLVFQGRK